MKPVQLIFLIIIYFISICSSQTTDVVGIAKGVNFMETKTYSAKEDSLILELYKGLRVADVSDGMDMVGLPGTGLVDPVIHACWIDLDSLSHQFRGIAVTVRYVPTQRPDRPDPNQDFQEWESAIYNTYSSEPFTKLIKPGTAIVVDDIETKDVGSIGSLNIMAWYEKGAVGVVTDAGARDTDEVALEGVPLYLRKKGRGIRPGRNEVESVNRPVVIGGVLVCPGDVVVADGDGVIIVPRYVAVQVAKYANGILDKDKVSRKALYKSIGLPLDKTVK